MTIAAIATPHAVGGISVIRISGEKAVEIAAEVFVISPQKDVKDMEANTCAYGKILCDSEEIDDGIVTIFKAPKSYTGEDIAEISCHGGKFITEKVLRVILEKGALPAAPGEFTKRAFLNGKMSLTQAEAIADLINSENETAVKSANFIKNGFLFGKIKEVTNNIISLLGELGAWVDYPEEDIPSVEEKNMLDTLEAAEFELGKIIKGYDSGRVFKEGIDTVLAGRPNVGKSTLMNLLSGYERSIVTDIAGTTRDIVEEKIKLDDYVLRLSDTAGIRDTDDFVEYKGVERAYQKIEDADLVLALFDNAIELSKEDMDLIESLRNKKVIAVVNKCDCDEKIDKSILTENFKYLVEISAKNDIGIDMLKVQIGKLFGTENYNSASDVIINERQKQCVINALSSVKESIRVIKLGETLDAVTVLIDEAVGFLLELSGETVSEAVVDNVFANFCVGK